MKFEEYNAVAESVVLVEWRPRDGNLFQLRQKINLLQMKLARETNPAKKSGYARMIEKLKSTIKKYELANNKRFNSDVATIK